MIKYSIGVTHFCGHKRAVAYPDTDGFLVDAKEVEKSINQSKIDALESLLDHPLRAFQSDDVVPVSVIKEKIKELSNGK